MLELRVRRLYRQDPLRYGFIAEYAACQLTADRLGLPVLAGPVEATALGNVLVQARAALLIDGTLEDLRAIVARSFLDALPAAAPRLSRATPRGATQPQVK